MAKFNTNSVEYDLLNRDKIILIGAGQLGEMTLRLWPQEKPLPIAFLDSKKTGTLATLPILALHDHKPFINTTYVLTFFKNNAEEVKKIFSEKLKQPIITAYDLFEKYLPETFSNGWGYTRELKSKLAVLEKIRQHINDKASLVVWDSVIAWRYGRKLRNNYPIEVEIEKFNIARFLNTKTIYDLVIDGGSYDLGFYRYLENTKLVFKNFIAFEPDPLSFKKCCDYKSKKNLVFIQIEKICLAKTLGKRYFNANGDFSARMTEAGLSICDATSIDYYFLNKFSRIVKKKRILIKLHIEGAELEAIEGSRNTILNQQVDFIINMSHTEDAILEIIPLLKNLKNYKLYLRNSSLFGEGLTLFAISPE